MVRIEDIYDSSLKLDTFAFLRFLITEKFRKKTIVTCSLRGRSVVLMKMISEIDASTPIVFCHMPNIYPESVEYRTWLIRELGLSDIREPAENDRGPAADDCNHSEMLWAENPIDHTRAYMTLDLNLTLSDCECWISGVYPGPYTDAAGPQVTEEGKLIRVDPLASWNKDRVRGFLRENDLPFHPQAMLRNPEPTTENTETVPTYHF
ncbi:MAG: phosphoadenosine phosphosulfate reductase family protein [Rhodospirillaceae bacterium]|jgi:phosphoadenosine phosphosulfate reductase|nr:phosphoadenosine phosphosulfate reductase family protein [Rhodospirillaceae bacterium]MBT6139644.1 phosphoadenosine phosphosulfate reductase family protein [Rhodospirillaceae bacterium]